MDRRLIAVVVTVVVVVAASVTAVITFHLHASAPTATQTPTGFPGMLASSSVSSILGGNWSMLANSSGLFEFGNDKVKITFINGTTITKPLGPNNTSNFELLGPSGQSNGGLPAWSAFYLYYWHNASANETYVMLVEIFKTVNSSQANWTLGSVASKYGVTPNESDGLSMIVIRPYAPYYVNYAYVVASYKGGSYVILVVYEGPASYQTLESLTQNVAQQLP